MKRTFVHLKSAWYGEANLKPGVRKDGLIDDIFLRVEADGKVFELCFEWFIGTGFYSPRFAVYNEEWASFPHIADLLAFMAQSSSESMNPTRLKAELVKLGFVDETPLTPDAA